MVTSLTQRFNAIIIACILISLFGCQDKEMPKMSENMNSLNNIQDMEWQKLSEKVIFFGHESVGKNILDGIRDILQENPKITMTITDNQDEQRKSGPLLIDSRIGKNGESIAKIDYFKDAIDKKIGAKANIAFMKLCYEDINATTDVEKIFNHYKETMAYLKNKYPKITFVHVTTPMRVNIGTWKTRIKEMLGKDKIWEYEDQIPREQYNAMLRKEYEGKEPIFDLAMIESTYPDGKKEFFMHKGTKYPTLVPEYTTDGGHLNEKGRRIVAENLLVFLSKL